jgi:nucleoside-diphosphate kinase
MERTLILLKPDAVKRGLVGEIISRFEKAGFKIAGMKMVSLN